MYRIEKIVTIRGLKEINHIWNNLLSQTGEDSVLLTNEWFTCWWDAYGSEMELMVLLVWDGPELIAIAPLARQKGRWRGCSVKKVVFIANLQSNRTGLIVKGQHKDIFQQIMKYLLDSNSNFDMLHLSQICESSKTDVNIQGMLSVMNFKSRRFINNRSPYIPIKESWEDYREKRTRNLKHKLNRLQNLYTRTGNLEVIKYENENIDAALNEAFDIAKRSWKHDRGSSIASREEETKFYSSLAMTAAGKSWINIWILKHAARPIAFVYNLIYKRRIYSLKIGYDAQFSKYSPGQYLFTQALADSFHNEVEEYDWLGTNLPFKMKWSDCYRTHHNYVIFNHSLRGNLLGILETKLISWISEFSLARRFVRFTKKMRQRPKSW